MDTLASRRRPKLGLARPNCALHRRAADAARRSGRRVTDDTPGGAAVHDAQAARLPTETSGRSGPWRSLYEQCSGAAGRRPVLDFDNSATARAMATRGLKCISRLRRRYPAARAADKCKGAAARLRRTRADAHSTADAAAARDLQLVWIWRSAYDRGTQRLAVRRTMYNDEMAGRLALHLLAPRHPRGLALGRTTQSGVRGTPYLSGGGEARGRAPAPSRG